MIHRRPIVAGNWKMNGLIVQSAERAAEIARELAGFEGADVVVCPPFTALQAVRDVLSPDRGPLLGAQDVHWEKAGAHTGEISAAMLADLSCRYVIVGHSERRIGFNETDSIVRRKVQAALGAGLTPIVCVGETLEQREAGNAESIVRQQLEGSLGGLKSALRGIVVAYEPVWAIGTGRTATAGQAQEAHAWIRELLGSMVGVAAAGSIRILYGGSLKPDNAAELFAQPDIDGGLVGGASLDPVSFVSIVHAAPEQRGKR